MGNNMRPIRWFFKAPPLPRAAGAVIFLALCAGFPRPGTISCPAGVAQARQHPLWMAEKTPPRDGARPGEGRQGETETAAPVPAAGKNAKPAPKAPLTPFKPSEKIKPGQAVDFPTDI